jgi:hypothetical protein
MLTKDESQREPEVGTKMPLDGDGTMVGDKITIAVAP